MLFSVIISFMNLALSEKRQLEIKAEKKLNIKQDMFCKIYATDPEILGQGSEVYRRVYKVSSVEVARAAASRMLSDSKITAKINDYLSKEGFNDETIDKQHLFLIKQKKDLGVSMKGIEHYNKLKKRVENKIEIIMPKPITELDDDEVIHKIDKSKALEIHDDESKDGSTRP